MLKSELVWAPARKGGRTYGVDVRYVYRAGGRKFTSSRYAFNAVKSSDSQWVHDALARFPAGREVEAFHDPARPERSVLRRGIDGSDIFVLMFLTPFNLVGFGLVVLAGLGAWRTGRAPKILEVRQEPGLRERIDAGGWGPIGSFFGVLGMCTFAGIFIVAIPTGFHPSLTKVVVIWGAAWLAAFWAAFKAWQSLRSGDGNLVIDRAMGVLLLPPMHGRKIRQAVPFREIDAIRAAPGDGFKTQLSRRRQSFEVQLLARSGQRHILAKHWNMTDAESWAEAFRQRLA